MTVTTGARGTSTHVGFLGVEHLFDGLVFQLFFVGDHGGSRAKLGGHVLDHFGVQRLIHRDEDVAHHQRGDQVLGAHVQLLGQVLHADALGDGDLARNRHRLVAVLHAAVAWRRHKALHRAFFGLRILLLATATAARSSALRARRFRRRCSAARAGTRAKAGACAKSRTRAKTRPCAWTCRSARRESAWGSARGMLGPRASGKGTRTCRPAGTALSRSSRAARRPAIEDRLAALNSAAAIPQPEAREQHTTICRQAVARFAASPCGVQAQRGPLGLDRAVPERLLPRPSTVRQWWELMRQLPPGALRPQEQPVRPLHVPVWLPVPALQEPQPAWQVSASLRAQPEPRAASRRLPEVAQRLPPGAQRVPRPPVAWPRQRPTEGGWQWPEELWAGRNNRRSLPRLRNNLARFRARRAAAATGGAAGAACTTGLAGVAGGAAGFAGTRHVTRLCLPLPSSWPEWPSSHRRAWRCATDRSWERCLARPGGQIQRRMRLPIASVRKMRANLFRLVTFERTGVRFARRNTELRKNVENRARLYFQLFREIVDTNLAHPPLFNSVPPNRP